MVSSDPRRGAPQHRRPRACWRAPGAGLRRARARRARARRARRPPSPRAPAPPAPPAAGEPLRAGHVFAAIAERIPRNAIVIEESPSSRPELLARLPARESLGSLSPAMGGLGFALPAAIGPAHGAARPAGRRDRRRRLVAVLDPGALERRAVPRRRALRDPRERRLRDHGPARRAGRRHAAVAGLRRRRRRPRARVRLPGAHASASTTSCSRCSTRCCRASRAAASRCCSRSRSRPTRRSRRDGRARASASPRRDASEQVAFEIRRYLAARDLRPGERLGHRAGARRRVRRQPARRCARGCGCSRART